MNEPAYATYASMTDPKVSYYPFDLEKAQPFKERLAKKWKDWCMSEGVEANEQSYPAFAHELMNRYLDMMYQAIRKTGAEQPIAAAIWDLCGIDEYMQAIADSKCEAITTGLYAGDWNKVGTGTNFLPQTADKPLDPRLDRKVRLVYEYDGIKTWDTYFYPACARYFRHMGVQICCTFQYDSSATAEWNTDWDAHYLNWLYTPGKSVSFEIGGRAFHDLPRGATFPTDGTTQRFGNCIVSFDRNISIYADETSYLASAPSKDWNPLPMPEKPVFIMAVGDSPYAAYSGSGIHTLEMDYGKRTGKLTLNPDADVVGDPWHPSADKSAVILRDRIHPFALRIPGVDLASVKTSAGSPVEVKDNALEVSRETYLLKW